MESKKYWDSRYLSGGNSGYGSYGEQLQKKLTWLSGLQINSISEIGCGDFNFGKHLCDMYPSAKYFGYDISKIIIQKNQLANPQHYFTSTPTLPRSDLLLCVDVLFHILDDNELEVMFQFIEQLHCKYFAVTAYEEDSTAAEHVRIRKFDYKRFGEPIIREIVEEDGKLYFYLFEKKIIDPSKISCCLNTKESTYPKEILEYITRWPWGEILIKTHSDSPSAKQELFRKAKYDTIYYQDDDAICPVRQLLQQSKPDMINVAMKQGHYDQYKDMRMTMGLGWGSIFPKSTLKAMDLYIAKYGEDEIYRREDTRILTYMNYPQNRLVLPVEDLPSALAPDRLWREPHHYDNIKVVEERCRILI